MNANHVTKVKLLPLYFKVFYTTRSIIKPVKLNAETEMRIAITLYVMANTVN